MSRCLSPRSPRVEHAASLPAEAVDSHGLDAGVSFQTFDPEEHSARPRRGSGIWNELNAARPGLASIIKAVTLATTALAITAPASTSLAAATTLTAS